MKNENDILAWLKSAPAPRVSHDLAPEILAKVRAGGASRFSRSSGWRFLYPLAAAAALALLLGGVWMRAAPRDPVQQTFVWLCNTQEPDGSWSTTRWGGDRHFEVALTSLSLISLLDGSPDRTTERAINKAVAYLVRSQQDDGRFGDPFSSSPYNQGMATLALARAYETRKDEALRKPLDRAVAVICAGQYPDGGWGYYKEAHPASNLSITLWQIEALRLASRQGWTGVKPNIERGLRWMTGVAAEDGSFGYRRSGDTPGAASQTLTAMGAMSLLDAAQTDLLSPGRRQAIKSQMQKLAVSSGPDMDYYRRYFLAAALKKMGADSVARELSALRSDLLTRQVRRGVEAGSWKPDDRWGSSGGRIYATAMATLALR